MCIDLSLWRTWKLFAMGMVIEICSISKLFNEIHYVNPSSKRTIWLERSQTVNILVFFRIDFFTQRHFRCGRHVRRLRRSGDLHRLGATGVVVGGGGGPRRRPRRRRRRRRAASAPRRQEDDVERPARPAQRHSALPAPQRLPQGDPLGTPNVGVDCCLF